MSTPQPPCRLTEVKDMAEYIGTFLGTYDLEKLSTASKETQVLFSQQLTEKKLLKAVFDADPKQVKEILDRSRVARKCLVLCKTHCRETYFSKKTWEKIIHKKAWRMIFSKKAGEVICKREWRNISPLEAAAWCGDIFLVKDLLSYVPTNQLQEASRQLRGILERKEIEEHGAYLAPYRALIQALEVYPEKFRTLNIVPTEKLGNHKELIEIVLRIWHRQRLLPTYGLQEYCDKTRFNELKSFRVEPQRSLFCRYKYPTDVVDLDFPRGLALIKGTSDCSYLWTITEVDFANYVLINDCVVIRRFCEERILDLRDIINELEQTLERNQNKSPFNL